MKTLAELKATRDANRNLVAMREGNDTIRIVVSMDACGIRAGAKEVLNTFVDEVYAQNLFEHVLVRQSGCTGDCANEPEVIVYEDGKDPVTYIKMNPEKAKEVVEKHIKGGAPVAEYTK